MHPNDRLHRSRGLAAFPAGGECVSHECDEDRFRLQLRLEKPTEIVGGIHNPQFHRGPGRALTHSVRI